MLNAAPITDAIVSALQAISDLAAAMTVVESNQPVCRIYAHHYRLGAEYRLAERIYKMPAPSMLVAWDGDLGGNFNGQTIWKHRFNVYFRMGNAAGLSEPVGYEDLWSIVCNQPPAGSEVTIVIRFKADAANTGNQTQITDSGCQNMIYANGMTPSAEVGNILRVIQGTGRGQLRKITGNTQTQLSWDLPLLLDTTSVWIVEAPAWDYIADSTAIDNADPTHAVVLNVPTDNLINQPLVIAGFTVDSNGNECADGDVPIREDWIYGAEGEAQAGFILPVAGVLGIQSDAAPAFYLNNDFTAGAIKAYVKSAPVGADLTFSLYVGTASNPWVTLTIPAGQKSVVATSDIIDALAPIPANTNVRLAITSVGTTYPGTDLTVFVYA
jgi:hypothetical protein